VKLNDGVEDHILTPIPQGCEFVIVMQDKEFFVYCEDNGVKVFSVIVRQAEKPAVAGTSSLDEIKHPEIRAFVKQYADVLPDELGPGLPPERTVQCEIKLKDGAKVVYRAPFRTAKG
jgi:hypothetical protein